MQITEVTDQVVAVRGRDVNWAILRDGANFTLVDAGYPRYARQVRQSIHALGLNFDDLAAIVVTHAHVDHIGCVPRILATHPVPVYIGTAEIPMAQGKRIESARPVDVITRMWRPRVARWALRIGTAGGSAHVRVPQALGVGDKTVLDIPGRPTTVLTPGHTSGHLCLQVGEVLLTGDALITGHALSPVSGPQMVENFFHTDPLQAHASLSRLTETGATVIVPGHGAVVHQPVAEAVEQVRQAAVAR